MGTRSFIAYQTNTGFEGVYCHWDGYLSHNGKILREHYSNFEKLKTLIAGGSISSLGTAIGEQHDFGDRPEGSTTFYHRDRGEDWKACQPKHCRTLKALIKYAERAGCEYFYLFDGQTWLYAVRGAQFFGMSDGSALSGLKPLPENLEDPGNG